MPPPPHPRLPPRPARRYAFHTRAGESRPQASASPLILTACGASASARPPATGEATDTAAGAAAAGGGGTFGQVQLVGGNNIYIEDSRGNTIKITPAPTATITVNKPGTSADFKPGDNVVVQGTADANGNIAAATSIAAATTGGFSRGGGAAATAATTPTTSVTPAAAAG
jgi:hypothetical protein